MPDVNAMTGTPGTAAPAQTRIVIVGAGFGGIGLGIKLKASGLNDFVILENSIPPAVCGATIATPVRPAMCRRIFILFLSNRGPTGRTNTATKPIFWTISRIARENISLSRIFAFAQK